MYDCVVVVVVSIAVAAEVEKILVLTPTWFGGSSFIGRSNDGHHHCGRLRRVSRFVVGVGGGLSINLSFAIFRPIFLSKLNGLEWEYKLHSDEASNRNSFSSWISSSIYFKIKLSFVSNFKKSDHSRE